MPTEQRDRAIRALVERQPNALQMAREVDGLWFRVQALAYAVRYATDEKICTSIALEAFVSADEIDDEYERVAVRAWPINAMMCRKLEPVLIESAIDKTLQHCRDIKDPSRRAYALMVLTQATICDGDLWKRMSEIIMETAPETFHWRGQQSIRDIVLLIGRLYPEEASRLIEAMPECKSKRQSAKRLAAGEFDTPHLFHWGK
ncbi:MAG: hypothetical protein O7G85_14650 [Planctomycetota bacterium]|nr:hypothetical protein [Planctomycetota bacterium]